MNFVNDILNNSRRALDEISHNMSKIKMLQAIAAQVIEDTERDAEAFFKHNQYNCAGKITESKSINKYNNKYSFTLFIIIY